MDTHTATLRGNFLAVPRPERFASVRVRPWRRWTETDILHLKAGRQIDLGHWDATGFHAVRIVAREGGVDITGSFCWREATEARDKEMVAKLNDIGAKQTDVAFGVYAMPTFFVFLAPLAVWFGNVVFDAAAVLAGVVITAIYCEGRATQKTYGTPRWLNDVIQNLDVTATNLGTMEEGDPRTIFVRAAKPSSAGEDTDEAAQDPEGDGQPQDDAEAGPETEPEAAPTIPPIEPLPVLRESSPD